MRRRLVLFQLAGLLLVACTRKKREPNVEDVDTVLSKEDGGTATLMTLRRLEIAKNLDGAEYMFRRVVSSWPGYATARVNLGSVYLDRTRQAAQGGASPDDVKRYQEIAIDQLEKAIACTPPPPARVRFMLGKAHARGGNRARGRELLSTYAASDAAEEPFRTEARAILAE